jgi:hypothetical protein
VQGGRVAPHGPRGPGREETRVIYEITQIKQWFIDNLGLRGEGQGMMLRVIDPVPDGRYVIPIGADLKPFDVEARNGRIHIHGKAKVAPSGE